MHFDIPCRGKSRWKIHSHRATGNSFKAYMYTTHNFISIIVLISIGLTAMGLPLRYSINFSVCLRFHRIANAIGYSFSFKS